MIRAVAMTMLIAGCASTPGTETVKPTSTPKSSAKAEGPAIDATVMIAGVAETEAVGSSAAHMIDAWACEAAERYNQRAEIRCKDDVDAILQVKAMQASFAMESGDDLDTEAMVKLMKASHYMAIAVDKLEDGQLAVTVLLADEIGKPLHKVSATAAGLEAIEGIVVKAVNESFEILAQSNATTE